MHRAANFSRFFSKSTTLKSLLQLVTKNNRTDASRIASVALSSQVSTTTHSKPVTMKYIIVTGGVISGLGKGVVASSLGTLLHSCGIGVTSIKIDPYINVDAGTFSPYEHGEVYVLDDGGEVDLDLGNYERFLDITLHRDNNITTGKIYKKVIDRERVGDYLGKTVQVVPHITDEIQEWLGRVATIPVKDNITPEVCIVELGGTIGDIESMPFVEALRQFQFRVKRENFCLAHVSLVPSPRATGEPKTKPTQASVRELRGLGLSPDLIVCRSEHPIGNEVKEKISNFCHVAPEQVICIHDLSSIYHVPLLMEEAGVIDMVNDRLKLNLTSTRPVQFMQNWRDLTERIDNVYKKVTIAVVGKYTKLQDSYASLSKSLLHASLAVGYKVIIKYIEACDLERETKHNQPQSYYEAWQALTNSHGVIVPGGFGTRGVEGKIRACQWSRENKKPFLGICLGLQAAVIEFARNILEIENATTAEIDPKCEHPLVIEMPEHHPGQLGGTMRLGKRTTIFKKDKSIMRQLYGNVDQIEERHRHRYEVNPKYVAQLEEKGMKFVGHDSEKTRMEIIELKDHPYYVATQFHPEYLSRPLKPSPPFLGLILASVGKLDSYLQQGNKLVSPSYVASENSSDEGLGN
ncbi:CTP synthase-like [Sabethes cyaneus]|uniref:CTP synthase-like n=1 Tax=Sabethes cyaneus TaxID=53552 RepID=UPI00237E9584|nr:CTP synthase-like [Sabethes cyaneus]XP_053693778.1 CTP synthase-like [Sabethes cyaneus]XP_053693779.1 CTP synthase-like [Sabethes cyaneus]